MVAPPLPLEKSPHARANVFMELMANNPHSIRDIASSPTLWPCPSSPSLPSAAATVASAQPPKTTPVPSPSKKEGRIEVKFNSKEDEQVLHNAQQVVLCA
jgi:hypothetical protein